LIFSNEAMLMAKYDGPVDEQIVEAARATASAWAKLVQELSPRPRPKTGAERTRAYRERLKKAEAAKLQVVED
jgi:hypothetical protein